MTSGSSSPTACEVSRPRAGGEQPFAETSFPSGCSHLPHPLSPPTSEKEPATDCESHVRGPGC